MDEFATNVEVTQITSEGVIHVQYEWEYLTRAISVNVLVIELPNKFTPESFSVLFHVIDPDNLHAYETLTAKEFTFDLVDIPLPWQARELTRLMNIEELEIYIKWLWGLDAICDGIDFEVYKKRYFTEFINNYPSSFFNRNYLVLIPIQLDEYTRNVEVTHVTAEGVIYVKYEIEYWDRAAVITFMGLELPRWFMPQSLSVEYK